MSVTAKEMERIIDEQPVVAKEREDTVNTAQQRIMERLQPKEPPKEEPSEDALQAEVAEQEPSTETENEAPTEEEVPVTEFGELSDHLGVDEDFLLSLQVKAKVNGLERSPTIKDLIANYQKGESADLKLMEVAETRKKFESEIAAEKQKHEQEWSRIQAIQSELENLLNEDDRQLEILRHADPAEYAARMQDKTLRLQRAERVRQQLQLETIQKRHEEYARTVAAERPKLLNAIPEWQDEKVREAETLKLRQYLIESGVQDWEIDGKFNNGVLEHPGITDHRFFTIARKAWLYDQSVKGSIPKKEKLKTLPKVGTGKRMSKDDMQTTAQQEARGRLKATGRLEDAAQAIFRQINRGTSK